MNPFNLNGKHIVISGASSGIGRQCAIRCSEAGAVVSLLGRNADRLDETLQTLNQNNSHASYIVDLTQQEEVAETVNSIVGYSGQIHGLINCAGVSSTMLLRSIKEDNLNDMFSTNVFSSWYLTKEVCRKENLAKDGGSIIFMSSVMGSLGEMGKSLYGMTKGALQAGAKSLACELSRRNIRVNSVSPGVIITPINERLPHIADPEKRAVLEKKHLLGLGSTDDVAYACIYLLSDAARWVTGTNLIVDGGYSAQ